MPDVPVVTASNAIEWQVMLHAPLLASSWMLATCSTDPSRLSDAKAKIDTVLRAEAKLSDGQPREGLRAAKYALLVDALDKKVKAATDAQKELDSAELLRPPDGDTVAAPGPRCGPPFRIKVGPNLADDIARSSLPRLVAFWETQKTL